MKPGLYKPIHDELARIIDTLEGPYCTKDRFLIENLARLSAKYDCSDLLDAYARKRKIYIASVDGEINTEI